MINTASQVRVKHLRVGLSVVMIAVVVVGDQILGVILDHGIGVTRDDRAHFLERAPQLLEPLLAALRALGQHRLDFAAALERRRERVEHRKIVAPEQRQDQPPLRRADDAKQGRLPFGGVENESFFSRYPRLGGDQETFLMPFLPSPISCALKSSSESVGLSVVRYFAVASSPCETSRGSNRMALTANT